MKVFWSWQSDTPGPIGRFFVRDVLADAIKQLKQPEDIEEPSERDTREALHLDHDRQGVSGSPDLASTIFSKIDKAAVFITDVTLVGQSSDLVAAGDQNSPKNDRKHPKMLINSNVAIEYGYALRALSDQFILMVQNVHYGDREQLPFDLKHKAGPIEFRLAPTATKAEIAAERTRLRGVMVSMLRPYLERGRTPGTPPPKFAEMPSTKNIAFFWHPSEILARIGSRQDDRDETIEYRFNEQHVFYLRLIPTAPLAEPLPNSLLMGVVERRRLQVLTRTINGGMADRNRLGAISYEPHGTSPQPTAITQLFRNGEIWGVSQEFARQYSGALTVAMVNLANILGRVLPNYIAVASEELKIPLPYQVEIGAFGLKDMRLSLPESLRSWPNQVSEPIYENELKTRGILNVTHAAAPKALIEEFLRKLYDLAGVEFEP